MNSIYDQLSSIIKTAVPKFKRKNTLFINKKILEKDLTANETIYINGINVYSDNIWLTGSVLSDHEIQIVYIHKTDTNEFTQPQAIQDLIKDALISNQHNQPYWYTINFNIENTLSEELLEGGWNGFIINLTVSSCEET